MSSLSRSNKGYFKRKESIKYWDSSPSEIDAGVENFVFFYKVLKNKNPNISRELDSY